MGTRHRIFAAARSGSGQAAADAGTIDGLSLLAITYLALPNLIFLFGWLRLPLALACAATMLAMLSSLRPAAAFDASSDHSWPVFALILLGAAAWAAFGGGSHFVYANPDWVVRDAVLGDLINQEWPVHYLSPAGSSLLLRSAIGFFLPPALFGKVFGSSHVDLAVFAWSAAGVLLFMLLLPLARRSGPALLLGIALTVFFSGMDFLGELISTQSLPMFPLRLEWWGPLSYPSLSVQLLWAPNHCLPIWIGTLLLLRYWQTRQFLPVMVAVLPLSLIWTPFAALGLLPFALLGIWRHLRHLHAKDIPWISVGAAALFSAPICLFLLLDIGHIEAGVANQNAGAARLAAPSLSLDQYLIFVSCEFLLLALVLLPVLRQRKQLFGLSVLLLLALPLVGYGPSNDLLLRLSTPPLIVLLVSCLDTLFVDGRPSIASTRWIAWLFLAIGAHSGFNELWRAAAYRRWPADYSYSLAQRQHGTPAPHYVGALRDSPLQAMLKPLPASGASTVPRGAP